MASQASHPRDRASERGGPVYPAGVPGKFDPNGHVQPFAGNTIICHLSPASPLYASLLALHAKLAASPLSHLYALLPPPSWHMTVFEGVCDRVRERPGHWPAALPADAPLADCEALFSARLAAFDLRDGGPPYAMAVTGFDPLEIGIGVRVEPRDAREAARLRGLRDRLSGALGIRHAAHASYGLHVSVAYLLRHLTDEQREELSSMLDGHFESMPKVFELAAPEFCRFDDMFEFKRVMFLRAQESSK